MALRRELTMGVDLGTSSISAGVYDRGQALLACGARTSIPCVVHFPTHGDPLVGQDAALRAAFAPRASVTAVKRLLGAELGDPVVRRMAALSPLALAQSPKGKLTVALEAGSFTAEEIMGLLLADVRDMARNRFGVAIRHVVVTVPATATELYERALHRAASHARLKIVEMIPDPVAGALGLGLHQEKSQRRLLVCDLGGGTFDAAAIIAGFGRLDVVATTGDANLGGDDFVDAMLGGLAYENLGHSVFDAIRERDRYHRLSTRLEPLKCRLSESEEVQLRATDRGASSGEAIDIDRLLTREWAEARFAPLVERAIETTARMLEHIEWDIDELDGTVLIGGAAKTPLVRQRFTERFGALEELEVADSETASVRGAILRSSQYTATRARRATRRAPPPPPREPALPDVVEPNMASTARIVPVRV